MTTQQLLQTKLSRKQIYLNNPKLKKAGVPVPMSQEQVIEYARCKQDPAYFIENYVEINTIDRGFVKLKLYPFQKQTVQDIQDNRFIILKAGRQVGKTTTVVGYLLWYILFDEGKLVAILANKAKTSREILDRIKFAYEQVPIWMQQGITAWNKGDIELENKCRIIADSTSGSAARGYTIHFLYLDEFAFVPNNVADDFFTSVFPTISSGTTSKILISSTPNGMNHFYRIWKEAEEGINGFHFIEANWRQVPGRDDAWAAGQRRVLGEQKYMQEMECTFLGSAGTLISATALKNMVFNRPVNFLMDKKLEIYEEPIPNHFYVIAVDSSRGQGMDYSAFLVFDTSVQPFKIVAKYRNNTISPMLFPNPITQTAKYYNDAYLLIENNDVGSQVADLIFYELEYDNMFHGEESNGSYHLSQEGRAKQLGLKTTKKSKRSGCNTLKELVENQRLVIQDFNVIEELSTFIMKKDQTYAAEEGSHDDLAMCCVLFAWLTAQPYFRDLTNFDIRQKLYEEKMKQIEDEMPILPSLGGEIENPKYYRSLGMIWETVDPTTDNISISDTYKNWY
jgi:Terminase RNaseH-like domain/Terminase large subunit, T4likevirus-type, N-terminal